MLCCWFEKLSELNYSTLFMRKRYTTFLIALILVSTVATAQRFNLKSYALGYRVFEIDAFGNNPLTIAPLLKDPQSYQAYINTIDWNSLEGNPGINRMKNFYVSAEFGKASVLSKFWEKYTVQIGLFMSAKLKKGNMAIGNEGWYFQDTTKYFYFYKPAQEQRFAGALVGINQRNRSSNRLNFIIGFQVQGSVALYHVFKQQWDSSTFNSPNHIWTRATTTTGPDLKASNYFQWQALVPFGLEINVYKQQCFVRAEAIFGLISGRYQKRYQTNWESHGLGLWLTYKLN